MSSFQCSNHTSPQSLTFGLKKHRQNWSLEAGILLLNPDNYVALDDLHLLSTKSLQSLATAISSPELEVSALGLSLPNPCAVLASADINCLASMENVNVLDPVSSIAQMLRTQDKRALKRVKKIPSQLTLCFDLILLTNDPVLSMDVSDQQVYQNYRNQYRENMNEQRFAESSKRFMQKAKDETEMMILGEICEGQGQSGNLVGNGVGLRSFVINIASDVE